MWPFDEEEEKDVMDNGVDLAADPGLVDPWKLAAELVKIMGEDERLIHDYGIDLGAASGEYEESEYMRQVKALLERRSEE